jgi:hypothetical protein
VERVGVYEMDNQQERLRRERRREKLGRKEK